MSKFNHKYGQLFEAINIPSEKALEIKDEIIHILINNEEKTNSEILERLMNKGLSFEEGMYAGFVFGIMNTLPVSKLNELSKDFKSHDSILASLISDIDGADDIVKKILLKTLNKKFSQININFREMDKSSII